MNKFEYYKGTFVLPEMRVRNLAVVVFHTSINYKLLVMIMFIHLPNLILLSLCSGIQADFADS